MTKGPILDRVLGGTSIWECGNDVIHPCISQADIHFNSTLHTVTTVVISTCSMFHSRIFILLKLQTSKFLMKTPTEILNFFFQRVKLITLSNGKLRDCKYPRANWLMCRVFLASGFLPANSISVGISLYFIYSSRSFSNVWFSISLILNHFVLNKMVLEVGDSNVQYKISNKKRTSRRHTNLRIYVYARLACDTSLVPRVSPAVTSFTKVFWSAQSCGLTLLLWSSIKTTSTSPQAGTKRKWHHSPW